MLDDSRLVRPLVDISLAEGLLELFGFVVYVVEHLHAC
jgi:hypothetical protein